MLSDTDVVRMVPDDFDAPPAPAPDLGVLRVVKQPSLYEAEESLVALLDTEAMVSEEQEEEFKADLAEQLARTVAKRDRVAGFIRTLEMQAKFAAAEIQRLQARKSAFENVAERLRGYVHWVIEGLGMEPPSSKYPQGRFKKLEGERFTMSLRACAPSLAITDADAIPEAYKDVTVTMPAARWRRLAVDPLVADLKPRYSVDEARVKAALMGPPEPCGRCNGIGMVDGDGVVAQCSACHGECAVAPTVLGADLLVGKYTLQVR